MRWFINKNGVNTGEVFDDRVIEPPIFENGPGPGPGEEGFTREHIDAELQRRSDDDEDADFTADYFGRSWPEVIELTPDESE